MGNAFSSAAIFPQDSGTKGRNIYHSYSWRSEKKKTHKSVIHQCHPFFGRVIFSTIFLRNVFSFLVETERERERERRLFFLRVQQLSHSRFPFYRILYSAAVDAPNEKMYGEYNKLEATRWATSGNSWNEPFTQLPTYTMPFTFCNFQKKAKFNFQYH